jgi:NAD+ synthase
MENTGLYEKLRIQAVEWIRHYMKSTSGRKAVIGISGGKDSTVAAALCVEALGKENVIGVMMPNGVQADIKDSEKIIKHLGIDSLAVDIQYAYMNLVNQINEHHITSQAQINMPPRLRMTVLYGVAQNIGGRVVNTCNLSEDTTGYSSLYGDSAGDFSPLARLTTEEIVGIGDALGLPHELVHKTPSDGLCGLTDEDNLGLTYHEINELIRNGVKGPNYEKIIAKYKANKFKTDMIRIPAFEPTNPLLHNYIHEWKNAGAL